MARSRRCWSALSFPVLVAALVAILVWRRRVAEGFFQCLRPKYEPDLWNDGGVVQESTNCMSYAMQEGNTNGKKMQPGQMAGLQPLQESEYSCGAFVASERDSASTMTWTPTSTHGWFRRPGSCAGLTST